MCKETKRITAFKPKSLTLKQKQTIREGQYASHNFTNHVANKIGMATWTNEHRQAWELARMDELA